MKISSLKVNFQECINFFNQKLEEDSHKNYYKSLIERFSADLFTLLIGRSFGDESRWDYFEKGMTEFFSLSMYSNNFDSQSSPGEQALHYRLLFHSDEQKTCLESKNEIIKMLTGSLRCIILTVSNTYIDAGGYAHE